MYIKEKISNERFDDDQIFITRKKEARRQDRQKLLFELERAVKLGNMFDQPTLICYTNKQGLPRKRDAVVVAVTERFIILKGGDHILLSQIQEVIV